MKDIILFQYNDSDEQSLIDYAKKLENMKFKDIKKLYIERAKQYLNELELTKLIESYEKVTSKGELGNIIEKYYFGYDRNSDQEADFNKLGIELKQTCVDLKKDGTYRAGERLSITNISYNEEVEENFENSHVWNKIHRILLIHYLRDKNVSRMDYEIKFVNLFSPSKEDLEIIKQDYLKIINMIKAGKAHELSESQTMYLGACTKGASAEKSMRPQFYGGIPAKKRNFCFKRQYMEFVLQNYVLQDKVPYEPIFKAEELKDTTFEDKLMERLNRYIGISDKQLCEQLGVNYTNNKAQWNTLALRMSGIKGNRAEEFEKAGIALKTIRIESNGKNKESISLPPIKFKELVKQTWEDSSLFEYFDTTKFLFVVFEKNPDENCYYFRNAKLWNMPYHDLNVIVKAEWNKIVDVINDGISFTVMDNGTVKNNLPKSSETKIIHMRPHTEKAAYKFKGYEKGNVIADGDVLPNGDIMTKQSFWLNRKYVLSIIQEDET